MTVFFVKALSTGLPLTKAMTERYIGRNIMKTGCVMVELDVGHLHNASQMLRNERKVSCSNITLHLRHIMGRNGACMEQEEAVKHSKVACTSSANRLIILLQSFTRTKILSLLILYSWVTMELPDFDTAPAVGVWIWHISFREQCRWVNYLPVLLLPTTELSGRPSWAAPSAQNFCARTMIHGKGWTYHIWFSISSYVTNDEITLLKVEGADHFDNSSKSYSFHAFTL